MFREMILLLMMKFLDFIFGDIRIPQAGPVFFKLLDFIFSHFSLNLTFRNATVIGTNFANFSDFVGLVIDSSDVEQNKGFLNSIDMTQSRRKNMKDYFGRKFDSLYFPGKFVEFFK